jgi:hypothetical protein
MSIIAIIAFGIIMFWLGGLVASIMAAARRGQDMDYERKYNALVEMTAKRTDQARGGKS